MATQPNWWESDTLAPANDPSFTGYIPGVPKPKEPDKPNLPSGYRMGPNGVAERIPGLPADTKENDPLGLGAKARSDAIAKYTAAQNIRRLVAEMREKYKTGPGATSGMAGAQDFLPTEANKAFDSAGQSVRGQVGTALGFTGGQLNSLAEAKMAVGPYIPQSSDYDTVIQDKMRRLEELAHNSETEAVTVLGGVPTPDGKIVPHQPEAVAPVVTSPPPTGGNGGGDTPPGMSELSDDQKRAYAAFVSSHNGKPDPKQLKIFLEQLTGKTVVNADEIAASLAQGQAPNTAIENRTYKQKVSDRLAAEDKLGLGENPATTLAMQGGTLGISDEAAGVGNALSGVLSAPFTGRLDLVGDYRIGRDVERQRIENAREQLGYGGTAIEGISGLASAGPSALAAFSPRAAVGAAATAGALGGWGSGEGTQDSLVRGAGGAAAGAALQGVGNVVARRLSGGGGMAPDLARASQAEGVDLIRPMVDRRSISEFGALESNRFSQPTIREGVERVREQLGNRVEALGQGGTPLEEGAAGGIAQAAGRRFIQRSRAVADRLYNRARALGGDTRFEPTQALAQVDNEIAQLNANPDTNAGEIAFLQGLRNDLSTPGGKTIEELRQLRASLRGRVNEQSLTATQAEARAIRAMDATQQDVASNIPAAASSYRRADTYYRERMTHIDDIIERITGGRVGTTDHVLSGEQAFARIKSMASPGGDGRRLAALMRDLEPSERQDIAATIASRLGRDAPDEPFSAAKFISQTRKLSPSARRTIFGPDGAESIQNLRTLSQALKDSGQDINRSRSATVLERSAWRTAARTFLTSITGLGGYAAGGTGGLVTGVAVGSGMMAAGAARKVLSARAMVNPRVSRWLAQAADINSRAQAVQATRRLGTIISREPALANELTPIYDFLQGRVSQPLAAQPQAEGGNGENQ